MQIEIKLDSSYPEPKIVIWTASMTEAVQNAVKRLSEEPPAIITGSRGDRLAVLEQEDILRIYANAGKVFAVTGQGEYVLRRRLYELEQLLDSSAFVRISNSEIIHLKKVDHFDLSFSGTICVKFSNGMITYVSRRYVSKIKKMLGI